MKIKVMASFLCCIMLISFTPCQGFALATETGSVLINEVCSSNKGNNGNLTDYIDKNGKFYDWVELFNSSNKPLDLSGYGISDKKSLPFKSVIPNKTIINAKSFLTIYCSTDYINIIGLIFASINISADGENIWLTPPSGTGGTSINVPSLSSDTTYGRKTDGSLNFTIMNPTPGRANSTAKKMLNLPSFSHKSGFYKNSFTLTVKNNEPNSTIFYTTDSSDPANSSTRKFCNGTIFINDRNGQKNRLSAVSPSSISPNSKTLAPTDYNVDKATVLRFCVVDNNGNKSTTLTQTYFVGSKASSYGNISVLSVTTDYSNLFDYNKGIYTNGAVYDAFKEKNPGVTDSWLVQTNSTMRGRDWERDCNIELFDNSGQSVLSQDCGMRIQGGASRAALQKSFRFTARSEYGNSRFNYPIFGENGSQKYKSFVVRNGGNSSQYLKFCDNLIQASASDRSFQTQQGKGCLVFLDGEFWGVYILQEDYNPEFLEEKYKVNADDVVMLQGGWELEEGTQNDLEDFYSSTDFIINNDMSVSNNFEKAKEILDMNDYLNYMAVQLYINNVDWPGGNWRIWRTREKSSKSNYADGRWRMLMFDTEFSAWLYGIDRTNAFVDSFQNLASSSNRLAKMFMSLMKNIDFKNAFYISFTDIANKNFSEQGISSILDNMYNYYLSYLKMNIARYNISNTNELTKRVTQIKTFFSTRREYAFNHLQNHFGSAGKLYQIDISTNYINAGFVNLNTSKIDFSKTGSRFFEGKYFSNIPVSITATANPRYKFIGWSLNGQSLSDKTLKLTLTKNIELTAVYEKIVVLGDANDDGKVDTKDTLLLRQYIAGLTQNIYQDADVNKNGSINNYDLLKIRQYLSKIIDYLP